ncbi:fructose-6-phosphate aldolase [Sphingobacterium alkalisoli]|uniref:Probable transaldolase n=1 Tax=Sphingobacterium alkalisoli TaxID=1874115 RepID=A0A4U0H4J7_9SPHI|nr:fructose-6-phosphate aldolase [Sphingobacterium alkalisoli]TJY66590.1 fructose-6-phosphate aldolase [Sphingobacterium alkalisoli]GGH15463.1 putative transaldolase [Sphingobacterium alkalisoli]
MKFFIDTANLADIQEAQNLGVLDGVTTNPSLMAKEGICGAENVVDHYKAICAITDGDVSAEVIAVHYDEIIREGLELAKLDDRIVVKVPMIREGIKAIKYFSNAGIKTNCTLVFSAGQALLAAKAGATYVSPFLGRLDDISTDGLELISDIRLIYDNYEFPTQILAASVRHAMHIVNCAKFGADVTTSPLSAITALLKHPLTDSGLAQFLADHKRVSEGNN